MDECCQLSSGIQIINHRNENSANQNSANQNSANQNSANQNSANQNSANQNSADSLLDATTHLIVKIKMVVMAMKLVILIWAVYLLFLKLAQISLMLVAQSQVALKISWYNKKDKNSMDKPNDMGVRISLINSTTISSSRYRHMLLTVPTRDSSIRADFKILDIHGSGLVWYQNYLYVADTEEGFRVFDLNRIIEVSIVNQIGFNGSAYGAFEYRYIVPQVGHYRKCAESCCNHFSSASLDRSTNPPSLLTGYYSDGQINGVSYRCP